MLAEQPFGVDAHLGLGLGDKEVQVGFDPVRAKAQKSIGKVHRRP